MKQRNMIVCIIIIVLIIIVSFGIVMYQREKKLYNNKDEVVKKNPEIITVVKNITGLDDLDYYMKYYRCRQTPEPDSIDVDIILKFNKKYEEDFINILQKKGYSNNLSFSINEPAGNLPYLEKLSEQSDLDMKNVYECHYLYGDDQFLGDGDHDLNTEAKQLDFTMLSGGQYSYSSLYYWEDEKFCNVCVHYFEFIGEGMSEEFVHEYEFD